MNIEMIEDIVSQEHYETTVDEVRGERIMLVMFYANWWVTAIFLPGLVFSNFYYVLFYELCVRCLLYLYFLFIHFSLDPHRDRLISV